MIELGIDSARIGEWFSKDQDTPYVFVRVSPEHAESWAEALGVALRRCYLSDGSLRAQRERLSRPEAELVAAKLPDPGSTMSGDFGEFVVFLLLAGVMHPTPVVGPKKWRLKQDRTKPAPYSDVVQFVVPSWPEACDRDAILCAEVKTKATSGNSAPIASAIADCERDRTSRLAKTLVWLHERARGEDLGSTTLEHLERFIRATDHPPANRVFLAVAVVCASLVADELPDAPTETPASHDVVVISIPDLKQVYESVFRAAGAAFPAAECER